MELLPEGWISTRGLDFYPRAGFLPEGWISTRGLEDKDSNNFAQAYRLVDTALQVPFAPNLTVMMDFEL